VLTWASPAHLADDSPQWLEIKAGMETDLRSERKKFFPLLQFLFVSLSNRLFQKNKHTEGLRAKIHFVYSFNENMFFLLTPCYILKSQYRKNCE